MYSNILASVRTTSEVDQLRAELTNLLNSIYQTGERAFEEVLKNKVRVSIAALIQDEITREQFDHKEYVEGLLKKLEEYEVVELTISFEPTESTIKKLFSSVNDNREFPRLIHIRVNPYIVGGVIVAHKGIFRDFSLARAVEEEILAKHEKIAHILFGATD